MLGRGGELRSREDRDLKREWFALLVQSSCNSSTLDLLVVRLAVALAQQLRCASGLPAALFLHIVGMEHHRNHLPSEIGARSLSEAQRPGRPHRVGHWRSPEA